MNIKNWFAKLGAAKVAVSGFMIRTEAKSYVDLHKIDDENFQMVGCANYLRG